MVFRFRSDRSRTDTFCLQQHHTPNTEITLRGIVDVTNGTKPRILVGSTSKQKRDLVLFYPASSHLHNGVSVMYVLVRSLHRGLGWKDKLIMGLTCENLGHGLV